MLQHDFCVVIAALHCGTEVYRDRVFSIATGLVIWCRDTVFWSRDRVELAGRCYNLARATKSVSYAHDRAVLSCGTLHCVVQLFEVTVHGHCSLTLFRGTV